MDDIQHKKKLSKKLGIQTHIN